jgi:hypothetical protein
MSHIFLSRREALLKIVATGTGLLMLMAMPGTLLVGTRVNGQTAGEATQLRTTVDQLTANFEGLQTLTTTITWISRVADPSTSSDSLKRVLEWFGKVKVVPARRGANFHDGFSNKYAFSSENPLALTSGGIPFGVNDYAWMSPAGRSSGTELNNSELDAVIKLKEQAHAVAFPDTPRLEPQTTHRDDFARVVISQNRAPPDAQLIYVRYFIVPQGTGPSVTPRPNIAFAYTSSASPRPMVWLNPIN